MKPFWKWVIRITVGLLIVLLIAAWYVNYSLTPLLEAKLAEYVHRETAVARNGYGQLIGRFSV